MPLVEGIRGSEPVRYCSLCELFPLQVVGVYYTDEDLRVQGLPSEWSHIGPYCPVCLDKIKNGEIDELRVA